MVDMKMGAIANNYGVVTLCLAARSLRPSNTSAAMIAGRCQQYKAHTSNAQPVMQAIVSSESEENLTAIFEDLCWLCKDIANFDLKSQLVQVHADYAPGIAAARRALFPNARLAPGRKKPDPAVANVMTLSDMTRLLQTAVRIQCLPTLQLADAIWQVIFEELPADVAKYLQRQFSLRRALCRTSSASSKVSGLRHAAPRNFGCQVSAWVSGGGTNPLEARRASWEAELKSRTRDGLLTALRGMQRLYSKWVTVFEWGKPLRMSAFSADENEYLLNSASLRSQGRSPAIDY
eukprot:s11911_g1.t1